MAYGSLLLPRTQLRVFGRLMVGAPDQLVGYGLRWLACDDATFIRDTGLTGYPAAMEMSGAEQAFVGQRLILKARDWPRADQYEGAEYRRVCRRLASGQQAWVYLDATT